MDRKEKLRIALEVLEGTCTEHSTKLTMTVLRSELDALELPVFRVLQPLQKGEYALGNLHIWNAQTGWIRFEAVRHLAEGVRVEDVPTFCRELCAIAGVNLKMEAGDVRS